MVTALPALALPTAVDELAAATRAASVETLAVDVPALLRAADAPAAALVHALYRDYALVTSAYILEPGQRGAPVRAEVPPQLAAPLWALAEALGLRACPARTSGAGPRPAPYPPPPPPPTYAPPHPLPPHSPYPARSALPRVHRLLPRQLCAARRGASRRPRGAVARSAPHPQDRRRPGGVHLRPRARGDRGPRRAAGGGVCGRAGRAGRGRRRQRRGGGGRARGGAGRRARRGAEDPDRAAEDVQHLRCAKRARCGGALLERELKPPARTTTHSPRPQTPRRTCARCGPGSLACAATPPSRAAR
jgi:hypothetical protein